VGATASGWLCDRIGRKTPLMIAILGYSFCNLAAGLAPTFTFLFLARAVLGFFMGAEWPAGSALAMETWPRRSRGLIGGILQGSWGIGFMMSFALYGLFYNSIGWRGMLIAGVLPAFATVYVRFFVKEPAVWVENRRLQREEKREVKAPLFSIFKRGMLINTLNACWWMASAFICYYSVTVLFATHLQVDLKMSPGAIGQVGVAANLVTFLASVGWGFVADKYGRRAAMIIPAIIAIPLAPVYLLSTDFTLIWWGFVLQGAAAAGGMQGQLATFMNERFPTEVRATASGFCYHQGAIWGGLSAPIIAYVANTWQLGYAIPMMIGTIVFATSYILALLVGPETKGKELVAELSIA
jgi:SHS family lactate transporter-like MFS transporter